MADIPGKRNWMSDEGNVLQSELNMAPEMLYALRIIDNMVLSNFVLSR